MSRASCSDLLNDKGWLVEAQLHPLKAVQEFAVRNDMHVVDLTRISIGSKVLGYGTHSVVNEGQLVMPDGSFIPCVIKRREITIHNVLSILRELHAMHQCNHRFVIKILAIAIDTTLSIINICMPLAAYGTLWDILLPRIRPEWLTIPKLIGLLIEVAAGLAHVHSMNILHRDVKSLNILVTKDRHVLLGDFSIAIPITDLYVEGDGVIGTKLYTAPETEKQVWRESDTYSLAVTILQSLQFWKEGCVSEQSLDQLHQYISVDQSSRDTFIRDVINNLVSPPASLCLHQALFMCLQPEPYLRMSVSGLTAALRQVLLMITHCPIEKFVKDPTSDMCPQGVYCRDMGDSHRDTYRHVCKFGKDCKFALRGEKRHMIRYVHLAI